MMLELRFQGSVENNGSTSGTIRGVSSLKYTTACVHNIHFFNSSSENCLLAQSFQKCLPLLLWQKLEEPRHRKQQHLWIPVVQVGPRQEGRADHFQTVAAGSVATQHQTRSFDRPLNDRQLALVQFDVDNLPWFRFPPRQFLLDLLLKLLLGQFPCPVQPGCTIKESKCCPSLLASLASSSPFDVPPFAVPAGVRVSD